MLAVGKSAPAWGALRKHIAGLAGVGGLSARAVGAAAVAGFREAPSGWVAMLNVVPKGHGCSKAEVPASLTAPQFPHSEVHQKHG